MPWNELILIVNADSVVRILDCVWSDASSTELYGRPWVRLFAMVGCVNVCLRYRRRRRDIEQRTNFVHFDVNIESVTANATRRTSQVQLKSKLTCSIESNYWKLSKEQTVVSGDVLPLLCLLPTHTRQLSRGNESSRWAQRRMSENGINGFTVFLQSRFIEAHSWVVGLLTVVRLSPRPSSLAPPPRCPAPTVALIAALLYRQSPTKSQ